MNTTLYRNGEKVGSHADPLTGDVSFTVPAVGAEYRLTTSVRRSAKVVAATTRVDASRTFRSAEPSGGGATKLPASPHSRSSASARGGPRPQMPPASTLRAERSTRPQKPAPR